MKFRYKKMIAFALFIVLLYYNSSSVFAADPYLDYGYPDKYIYVKDYTDLYNSTWISILEQGIIAWNSSTSKVVLGKSENSTNTIEAGRYSQAWYGLTTQYRNSLGRVVKFEIQINARTIGEDAANIPNFAKSTAVHEYGHVLWLCDNPSTSYDSIMKYSRNREKMIVPQYIDIVNVNAKYS